MSAEVARAHVLALTRGTPGRRYILGGENLTLKQILDKMSAITGIPSPTVKIPFAVAATYAFFEEWITGRIRGKEPRATLEEVRMGRKKMFASSARAQQELGFRIVPVYPAMRAAIEWFRANGYAPADGAGPRMTRIAIIAALPGELKPLVRGWPHSDPQRRSISGRSATDEEEWIAACAGAGQAPPPAPLPPSKTAAPSTSSSPSAGPERSRPRSPPAPPTTSPESSTSAPASAFDCDAGAGDLWLATSPTVADEAEKRRLASAYHAALVDMEAAAIARLAAMRGIPFYCIKGVSDALKRRLPDFNRFHLARRPASSWPVSFFLPLFSPGTGPHSSGWAKIVERLPKASRSRCSSFSR